MGGYVLMLESQVANSCDFKTALLVTDVELFYLNLQVLFFFDERWYECAESLWYWGKMLETMKGFSKEERYLLRQMEEWSSSLELNKGWDGWVRPQWLFNVCIDGAVKEVLTWM